MKHHKSYYKREGEYSLIEIKLETVRQLFNTFDPDPFPEKDIDRDAEEYIVGATGELHLNTPAKLVFRLPASEHDENTTEDITQGIRHYFSYRAEIARRELVRTLKNGRMAMFIGLGFLILCIIMQQTISSLGKSGLLWTIIEEGFLISGWVAMWHPIDIFLYQWWPIRRKRRIYEKIASMPIEVRHTI